MVDAMSLFVKKAAMAFIAGMAICSIGSQALASEDKGLDGRQVEEFKAWRDNGGGGRCLSVDSSWNGYRLARVLYCSKESSESDDSLSSSVYSIMTTRDPAGWLNPYWITDKVSTHSYGYTGLLEGSEVGRYYDSSYAAWGSFVSMLRSEFSRRDDIKWWGVTKGTCFDESTYREFEYNCNEVLSIAEGKDSLYRELNATQTEKKVEKKPAKKKKAKKKG